MDTFDVDPIDYSYDSDINIDSDDLTVEPEDTILDPDDDDIDLLKDKALGVERLDEDKLSFRGLSKIICPTRHGCQGATNCDYAYGNYPG